MKVIIREKTQFEIEIDGKTLGVFSKGSDWNGMTEFNNGASKVVVGGFDSGLFNGIFGTPEEQECNVVTLSPELKGREDE